MRKFAFLGAGLAVRLLAAPVFLAIHRFLVEPRGSKRPRRKQGLD
jgi:hypothetical protein